MKQMKNQVLITALCAIGVGLVLLIMPGIALTTITRVLAVALLIIGIVRVVAFSEKHRSGDGVSGDLVVGIVLVVAALFCFFRPDQVANLVTIVLGFGLVLQGVAKLAAGIELRKVNYTGWNIPVLMAAVNILLGIIVIFVPGFAQRTLIIFIGISLMAGGLTDLYTYFVVNKNLR